MKILLILLAFAVFLILSILQPPTQAQLSTGDCDDSNFSINPGVIETGSLCFNLVDDNCNGLIDCADPQCAASTGPNGLLCCQLISDCNSLTTGTCGSTTCNNNECNVLEDASLCTGMTSGQCGLADGTCTSTSQGFYSSYDCNFQDDVTQCSAYGNQCDFSCSGSPDYLCENLGEGAPSCALTYSECINATQDPFKEPTNESQCICYGLWEACGP